VVRHQNIFMAAHRQNHFVVALWHMTSDGEDAVSNLLAAAL
jgi:hypothetical protein